MSQSRNGTKNDGLAYKLLSEVVSDSAPLQLENKKDGFPFAFYSLFPYEGDGLQSNRRSRSFRSRTMAGCRSDKFILL